MLRLRGDERPPVGWRQRLKIILMLVFGHPAFTDRKYMVASLSDTVKRALTSVTCATIAQAVKERRRRRKGVLSSHKAGREYALQVQLKKWCLRK